MAAEHKHKGKGMTMDMDKNINRALLRRCTRRRAQNMNACGDDVFLYFSTSSLDHNQISFGDPGRISNKNYDIILQ